MQELHFFSDIKKLKKEKKTCNFRIINTYKMKKNKQVS